MSAAASRRREWALGLGVALPALPIRAPLFDLPFERDEDEYAYSPGASSTASCRTASGSIRSQSSDAGAGERAESSSPLLN